MRISWWDSERNEVECLRLGPRHACLSQSLQGVVMPSQGGPPMLPSSRFHLVVFAVVLGEPKLSLFIKVIGETILLQGGHI